MVKFALRIPETLYEKLKELAEKERRSINSQIIHIIEEYIKKKENTAIHV